MKKIIFLTIIVFLAIFTGFGSGSRGWTLAFKKNPTIRHIYTDLDQVPIGRHYVRMIVGYDSRLNMLLFWEKIR